MDGKVLQKNRNLGQRTKDCSVPTVNRPKKFYLEIYDMKYLFFIQWDRQEYSDYLEKFRNTEGNLGPSDSGETFFDMDSKTIIIWVEKSENYLEILCHECVHAACFTLQWCGVKADFKNDESLAYLCELLFKKATVQK